MFWMNYFMTFCTLNPIKDPVKEAYMVMLRALAEGSGFWKSQVVWTRVQLSSDPIRR
jgi:hypothetical protein